MFVFSGWNDGTLSQLQIDWSEQEVIPGDYTPGEDPTFENDPNGVSCYECLDCKKDYFDSKNIGVQKKTGCYVCTKEWLQGECLSQSINRNFQYIFFYLTSNVVIRE